MGRARDEQGNIWETDAQGQAVRLVQAAGQSVPGGIVTKQADPKRPYEAPTAAADLTGKGLNNTKTAREIANMDRSPPPSGYRYNGAGNLEKIPGGPPDAGAKNADAEDLRKAQFDALVNQINQTQTLFNQGPGKTHGVKSVLDFLPTESNKVFDTAGSGLADQSASAFRIPGIGSQSDKDAARAAAAAQPFSSDYDGAIVQKLKQTRDRVDYYRKANGLPPAVWTGIGGIPDDNGNIIPAKAATPGAANGPPPANGGGNIPGGPAPVGPSGSPVITPLTGNSTTKFDAAASARLDALIRQGKSSDEINAAFPGYTQVNPVELRAAQAYLKKNPTYKGSFADVTKEMPTTTFQRAAGGLTDLVGDATSTGIINAGNAVVPLALLPGASPETNDVINGASAANPNAALLGSLIGGIPAAAGAELGAARFLGAKAAPRVADAAYGAVQGYGNADEGNGLIDGTIGGIAGLLGGGVGRRLVAGTGAVARGASSDAVRYLHERGIPLTVGQATGGVAKQIEDAATSFPIIGGIINNRRREGFNQFNREAFDQALGPIGESTGGVVGAPGIDLARAARGRGYSQALDGVNVQADAPFISDMQGVIAKGQGLPDPMAGYVDASLRKNVGNVLDVNNGGLTGDDYQQIIRGLRRDTKSIEGQPFGHDFADAAGGAESALTGILDRQAPDVVPAYQNANAANRGYEIVRDAVNRARNGTRTGDPDIFAPSQLSDAASGNAKKFGNSQGTTDVPFYDLARAGQEVLPSKIGDSGTAPRMILGSLAALAAGGSGAYSGAKDDGGVLGAAEGGGKGLGGLAALIAAASVLGTRGGQRGLVSAMVDRPQGLRSLGDSIYGSKQIGGIVGTPGLESLLNYFGGGQ